jgi:hypothetical protein
MVRRFQGWRERFNRAFGCERELHAHENELVKELKYKNPEAASMMERSIDNTKAAG